MPVAISLRPLRAGLEDQQKFFAVDDAKNDNSL